MPNAYDELQRKLAAAQNDNETLRAQLAERDRTIARLTTRLHGAASTAAREMEDEASGKRFFGALPGNLIRYAQGLRLKRR